MFFEEAKAKAKARLEWVADNPEYRGVGDEVISALLKQLAEHETAALVEIDRLLGELDRLRGEHKTILDPQPWCKGWFAP